MKLRHRRRGYTLFELIVVMAILLLFVSLVIPSLSGLGSGNHAKAAADVVRGELAAARSWAMQEGFPVRVAVSADGTKIRRAPETEFTQAAVQEPSANARRVEYAFEKVTATVMTTNPDGAASSPTPDSGSWVTVAVVLPDGTCRDDRVDADDSGNQVVTVALRELGYAPNSHAMTVTVRGVTGQVSVGTGTGTPNAANGGKR